MTFHVEHIVASQHEGDDTLANLALACPDCNRHKGPNLTSIDPLSGEIITLFHPRQQAWRDHFEIVGIEVRGRTSIGRTTVRLLQFNSPERLAVRSAIQAAGDWPPLPP